MDIHLLSDLKENDIRGKKVILRVDFNVPIKEGKVSNSYRIDRAMPTIEYLRNYGARILLISHIETKNVDRPSLLPVYKFIKENFPDLTVTFLKSFFGDSSAYRMENMIDGEVILFENIRQYEEEKQNNEAFAKSLAMLGDLYINDAFAASHREHASIVGIPKFLPSYAGLLLADEIKNLNISNDVPRPFLFILGGAKFETKLPLIQKFLDIADNVFVGGALANDVLKAKGNPVGKSLVSDGISIETLVNNPKLIIPTDVICKNGEDIQKKSVNTVSSEDVIVDIGPETMNNLDSFIKSAKYILWNGPFGNFEIGFKDATVALAESIGKSEAQSVVGGGDTLAAIQELKLLNKFTFISTGGGAMLDYLLAGTLVGIDALKR